MKFRAAERRCCAPIVCTQLKAFLCEEYVSGHGARWTQTFRGHGLSCFYLAAALHSFCRATTGIYCQHAFINAFSVVNNHCDIQVKADAKLRKLQVR